MYTCQCEGLQMGQSSGDLFKEVSAFQRCRLNKGITTCIHEFEPVWICTILPTVIINQEGYTQ